MHCNQLLCQVLAGKQEQQGHLLLLVLLGSTAIPMRQPAAHQHRTCSRRSMSILLHLPQQQ
jgi:hypothetical protein